MTIVNATKTNRAIIFDSRIKQLFSVYQETSLIVEINSQFARKNHAECGKGFIYVDVTQVLNEQKKPDENLPHWWYNASEYKYFQDVKAQKHLQEALDNYDSSSEYILFMAAQDQETGTYIYGLSILPLLSQPTKPKQISGQQIRKRLKRMKQAGFSSLIIDPSQPDFMGENSQKWLTEIQKMNERENAGFQVIINSDSAKHP